MSADPLDVIVLANRDKPEVIAAMGRLRSLLDGKATIVGEYDVASLDQCKANELPEAELALVLGGDGTLLSQARCLIDREITLLGINFGKLGFLAEFSLESLAQHWPRIADRSMPTTDRLVLDVFAYGPDAPKWGYTDTDSDCATDTAGKQLTSMPEPMFQSVAINDAVITAGEPFRMIELEMAIDPSIARAGGVHFAGDGVIVSTPSGSTAYNLASGGPILSPGVEGMCIAAICPQSLAFRPIVLNAQCDIWLTVRRANPGTTLMLDGQTSCQLDLGQQVHIRRHERTIRLMHNPDLSYWSMLAGKMHWAARPRREHLGEGI